MAVIDAIDEWLMLLTGGLGNAGERTKALPAGAGLVIVSAVSPCNRIC